jgi:hypothetical protein
VGRGSGVGGCWQERQSTPEQRQATLSIESMSLQEKIDYWKSGKWKLNHEEHRIKSQICAPTIAQNEPWTMAKHVVRSSLWSLEGVMRLGFE